MNDHNAAHIASETIAARPIRSMRGETYQSQVFAVNPSAPREVLLDALHEALRDVHDELARLWVETVNEDGEFEHLMSPEDACNMASRCMNTLDRAKAIVEIFG